MKKRLIPLLAALALLILIIFGLYYYQQKTGNKVLPSAEEVINEVNEVFTSKPSGVTAFTDAADFKTYLESAEEQVFGGNYRTSDFDTVAGMGEEMAVPEASMDGAKMNGQPSPAPSPDRVSETNVQVSGIDEPDIVKTNGSEIFYSNENYYWWGWGEPILMKDEVTEFRAETGLSGEAMIAPDIAPMPPRPEEYGGTKLIKATPPESMKVDGRIDLTGNLLLSDNKLLVIDYDQITAYDVSDPAKPTEIWDLDFDNSSYQSSRLMNGKLYLMTSTWVDWSTPCPFVPVTLKGEEVSFACGDIYHPSNVVPTDVTYNVMILDPDDGELVDQVAFVGSSGNSVVYMSGENIYVTNSFSEGTTDLMINFVLEDAADLVSPTVLQKLRTLKTYDLSDQAKLTEFSVIMENFGVGLNDDERLKLENEFSNRIDGYMDEHKRELMTTGIVKIDVDDLSIDASGEVPGYPLNQFSLDEYDGNLRIATTVGGGFWISSFGSSTENTNDLYVFDDNLKSIGSILGLGDDERIYSARFIGDRGYLVTFRETDPFFVLDLSNPREPKMTGELKIPGYSSYLHPLKDNIVLGVGQEDWQVKLSLFDVSDPANPVEVDKYQLSDYWSEVQNTHHAFLQDEKFEVFFMPGGQGGYVFSYKDNKLALERAITGVQAERALYINDYLYVIGPTGIEVLNENDWQSAGHLDLQ